MLEIAWMKIQCYKKTTFSSLKINDFRSDFEERTFLKFWSKKFEICSNSIFCSQILHGMLLARAITPKARQNSFFEKCFRILCFFLKIEFSTRYFEHDLGKKRWLRSTKVELFKTTKNGTKWAFLKKLQTNFLAWILPHEHEKHRSNQKYRSKIFFDFFEVEKVTSLDVGGLATFISPPPPFSFIF